MGALADRVLAQALGHFETLIAEQAEAGRYVGDPGLWAREKLGAHLWSRQIRIAESVRDNRLTAVQSCHGVGKALALDTPLPTPTGWTSMGAVQVGDFLLGEYGQPVRVIAMSDIQHRPTFRVTFDDRSTVTASDNHLWQVLDLGARHRLRERLRSRGESAPADWREHWELSEARTTAELAKALHRGKQLRWAVPTTRPIEGGRVDLPVPAYTLGAWLGDGVGVGAAITVSHEDAPYLLKQLEADGVTVRERMSARRDTNTCYGLIDGVLIGLRAMGVLGVKHIPMSVLRADEDTRLAVLQGLMDTDGFVSTGSSVGLDLMNRRLSEDAAELARSFGWKVRSSTKRATLNGKDCGTVYRLQFRPDRPVFRLPRKADRFVPQASQQSRHTIRTIVSVERVRTVPTKCVTVDSPTSLYLAGESFIPTHNSFLAAQLVAWWLDTHPPGEARVVTTAPTGDQVKAILWSEINGAFAKAEARGRPFLGRINETDWKLGKRLIAFGRKPSDYNPHAFQGIHAKYVLVILDEACHDNQTDVMTEFGWRRFADLDGSERLLTMDPETQVATYRKPSRLVAYPYRGKMYSYAAKGANFCVTPNHDMYFKGRHGRYGEHRWEWRKAQMQEMAGAHGKYMLKTINWEQEDTKEFLIPECVGERKTVPARAVQMDDWMAFLGWYCSEGHIIKRKGRVYGAGVSQKDPETLAEIHDLCVRLGMPAKLYPNQVHIHSMQIGRYLATLGKNCLEKAIPDYARNASARQIALFLDTFTRGDGYRKGKGEILYTSSPEMADDLHEMILKTGVPSVIRKRKMAGQKRQFATHTATTTADGYVITRPHQASTIKYYPDRVEQIDYDGMVYCADVPPEHMLFTRRNGYTLWSGNCGVNKQFWTAARAIATGEHCRILAVGNPDDPGTEFARVCSSGRWNTIKISAFDTPNFTGEEVPDELREMLVSHAYVEEMALEYGEESPTYLSKVLGEFPSDAEDGVVRLSKVRACCRPRDVPWAPDQLAPVELGVDLGAGGDETCIRERRGAVVGREWRFRERDPKKTAARIVEAINQSQAETVKVDSIGIGWGLVGMLQEKQSQGLHKAHVVGVNVSEASTRPDRFKNLRSQIWWEVGRQLSEDQAWDMSGLEESDRERLVSQLTAPKYTTDSAGRTVVEPKAETKKRIGRSPDNADALLLAFHSAGRPRLRWL